MEHQYDDDKLNLSVVIPAYNSELTISKLVRGIILLLRNSENILAFEIIIVDDHSKDTTWNEILSLKEDFRGIVRGIKLESNHGQHRSTLKGIKLASANTVITIDDDLQVPPEEILKLIDSYQNSPSEVVYGIYEQKKHALIKNLGSTILTYFLKRFGSLPQKSSSFRLINRRVVEELNNVNRNFYFLEGLIPGITDKIVYENVRHLDRLHGKSNYSFVKMFWLFINIIFEYTSFPSKTVRFGIPVIFILFSIFLAEYIFQFETLSTYYLLLLSIAVSAVIAILTVTLFIILNKWQSDKNNNPSFQTTQIG